MKTLLVLAIVLSSWLTGCARGAAPARPVEASAVTAPRGLVAMRPRFRYTGGLELTGGVAFAVRASNDWSLAVTAAHLVGSKAEWRSGAVAVESVELLDAGTRALLGKAAAVAFYGTRESGIDLARNVTVFVLEKAPDGVAQLDVARRAPEIGEDVTVFLCGSEGGPAQVAVDGVIVHRDAGRVEVEVDAGVNARAMAGAPVVSRRDGTVVAVAHSAASRGDRQVFLCGPASGLREALDSLPDRPAKVAGWKAPAS